MLCFSPRPPRWILALALALLASAPARSDEPPIRSALGIPLGAKSPKETLSGALPHPGLITVWRKADKLWLEIPRASLGRPLMLSLAVLSGLPERGLYGSHMSKGWMVKFHQTEQRLVQLRAMSLPARFDGSSSLAIEQSRPESLLSSAPAAAEDERSVLVDASALLSADLPGWAQRLEQAYGAAFAFDAKNSELSLAQNRADQTSLTLTAHYQAAKLGPRQPDLPHPHSALSSFGLAFYALPERAAPTRSSDPRVGYFETRYDDLSEINPLVSRKSLIQRWRLRKKDPAAAMSEPVEPIVFWMSPNVPSPYRQAVAEGVLMWNQAFERLGYRNAIEVKASPPDRPSHGRGAHIAWFSGNDASIAMGPSRSDPRTGEILEARVQLTDLFPRSAHSARFDAPGPSGAPEPDACLALSEAPGRLESALASWPQANEAQARGLAMDYLRHIAAHEAGHALGLRHNFKASASYPLKELDLAGARLSSSVMDYLPFNLPASADSGAPAVMRGLGAYDLWAIEYGYGDPAAGESEAAFQERIAHQSSGSAELAYATDEDASGSQSVDPDAALFDLSNDPLGFHQRQFDRLEALIASFERQNELGSLKADSARRALRRAIGEAAQAGAMAAKRVGGARLSRSALNAPQSRFEPLSAREQRQALSLIFERLFAPGFLSVSPDLLRRLPSDYAQGGGLDPSFDLAGSRLAAQRPALDALLSPALASRSLDAMSYQRRPGDSLSLAAVYEAATRSIWRELFDPSAISPARASLQREHARKLALALTQPGALPAEAKALLREQARIIAERLRQELSSKTLSARRDALQIAQLREARSALIAALDAALERQEP